MAVSTAAAGDYSIDGYVKSYFFLFKPASVSAPPEIVPPSSSVVLLSNRVRLQASYSPHSRVRVEAAYDLGPRLQSEGFSGNSLLFGQLNPFTYRAADLAPALYPSETEEIDHFVLGQNLDRLSGTLRSKPLDVTVGRQAIAWGSARAVNPTDILAPFSFEALDTEDRIGIDALRARIPLGALSEIDAGYIFGRDLKFDKSAFFVRTVFNTLRTDVSFLFMGFRENLLFGFDVARPIGGAGFWLETAFVSTGALNGKNDVRDRDYFRASTGVDYNLTGNTYGFVEYHFNGAGAADPLDYAARITETAYTEGSVYLTGRHYIIPGLIYQYNPLSVFTFQSLINVTDPSVFLTPQVEYNIAPNLYLGAGAFIGIGENPVLTDSPIQTELRSEFGGYPNIFFTSIRYYF